MAQLLDWRSYLMGRLVAAATAAGITITAVGVDSHRVRVTVSVPSEDARAWVERTLTGAAIPCGLVDTDP